MEIIKLNCRNQRLSRYNSGVVASNSYGYLKIQVNFMTDDWSKVSTKIASFSYRGRNYSRLLDANNMCEVPKEVIKPGEFKISVWGGGITSNTVTIRVEDSGIVPYEDSAISDKYYNEIINQLTATIDELNETKADNIVYNEDSNTIQLSANGQMIGDPVQAALCNCGIKSFDVDENDNITITLIDGRIISLGHIEGASGVTFIPHIDENQILTWTNNGGLENPDPVDLNPFDEWYEDGEMSGDNYTWEDE
jgi:hypothetical protein